MSENPSRRGTKVARCLDTYDLPGLGATLEARWTGEAGERASLRDLATEFNQALVESALQAAGVSALTLTVESTYEALRNGSSTERMRVRRQLEREGVDVETLTDDFVSHQAVHTYLTADREASLPEPDGDGVTKRVETIDRLEGRVAAVAEAALDSLGESDTDDAHSYEVFVDVTTVCTACGASNTVREMLAQGGCSCRHPAE